MAIFVKILKSPHHLENLYVYDQLSIKQNLWIILRLIKCCLISDKTEILKFCKQVLLIWQQVLCAVGTNIVNTHSSVEQWNCDQEKHAV